MFGILHFFFPELCCSSSFPPAHSMGRVRCRPFTSLLHRQAHPPTRRGYLHLYNRSFRPRYRTTIRRGTFPRHPFPPDLREAIPRLFSGRKLSTAPPPPNFFYFLLMPRSPPNLSGSICSFSPLRLDRDFPAGQSRPRLSVPKTLA